VKESNNAVSPQHVLVNKTMLFTRAFWGLLGKATTRQGTNVFKATATELQQKAEIGIFWDYENMRVPGWCSTAKASESIRKHVESRGRIVERKLYFDSSKTCSQQPLDRTALDLSGFSLIDCPCRNNKETIDKKVIVDMLCFSYERALKGSNVQVVLISSNGEYSYTLAKLRDIGVSTFVIYSPEDRAADILTSTADEAITWEDDILGGCPVVQPSHQTKSHTTNSTSMTPADNKNTLLFLRSVFDEQESRYHWWVRYSRTVDTFYKYKYKRNPEAANRRSNAAYRRARTDAIQQCYVEIGREDLTRPVTTIVTSPDFPASSSNRSYLRLTALGLSRLQGSE
jgi:hypothetical protein